MKLYVGGRPTFFTFFYVFSDFKKHDFFTFFELLHTFSRTLMLSGILNNHFTAKLLQNLTMKEL